MDKSDGQNKITLLTVSVIYFVSTYLMLESLLFGWASRVRWQLFIIASAITVFGFVFYWFCWPTRLWQRTMKLPRNRGLLVKIAIIYIMLCVGLAAAANYMTVRLFEYHFVMELVGLVIPYQYLYFFWLGGTTISISALLWAALLPLKNELYEQNLKSMFTTWGEVIIMVFWVLALLQILFSEFELIFWLWYILVSMFLACFFVLLLRLRVEHKELEKTLKAVKILLGSFSFLTFYKFWESTWQFVIQREEPNLYDPLPTMFFSMILICWAISAGIALIGLPSKHQNNR